MCTCTITHAHGHMHTRHTWTQTHAKHMDTCRHTHTPMGTHTHAQGYQPLHTLVTQQILGPCTCFLPRHRLFCQLGVQPWASLIRPPAQPRAKGSESHTWPFSGHDGSSRPRHSHVSRKSWGPAWRQGGSPAHSQPWRRRERGRPAVGRRPGPSGVSTPNIAPFGSS